MACRMNDALPQTPKDWRNFTTRVPIAACRLKRDGLKRLYRILDERQREYRDKILRGLSQMPEESPEEFRLRRNRVSEAFVVSVTISAESGELLNGNREEIFDDTNFPTKLRSVFYSTQSVPRAVLNHIPQDRISVFLDFSQPPLLDLGRLPTLPTLNESNFEIDSDTESWFVTTKAKLATFFDERRVDYDWIHRAGMYDILLFTAGMPFAVWACVKLEAAFPKVDSLNVVPRSLAYAYTFMIALILFRAMFSYSRWVFPKIEIESEVRRAPFRHRTAWAVVVSGLALPALYDVAKAILASALHWRE